MSHGGGPSSGDALAPSHRAGRQLQRTPCHMNHRCEDKSDAALVAEILLNRSSPSSDDAYRTLLERYWKVVVVILKSRLNFVRDAEDIAQEAFVRAWRSLDRLENPRLFLGWLLRIARNLAIDQLRRKRHETSLDTLEFTPDDGAAWNRTPPRAEERLEQEEEWAILERALRELPDRYRTVVTLRYLEGLSNQEMARSLGEPEGTIRNRLFRALRKLRELIERQRVSKP